MKNRQLFTSSPKAFRDLPTGEYFQKLSDTTKRKHLRKAVGYANKRLKELRNFLDVNPMYRSPVLERMERQRFDLDVESGELKPFTFHMPNLGKYKRDEYGHIIKDEEGRRMRNVKTASATRVYSDIIDFLTKKTTDRDYLIEQNEAMSRSLGEIESRFIQDAAEEGYEIAPDIDNWDRETQSKYWRGYDEFKERIGSSYKIGEAQSFQAAYYGMFQKFGHLDFSEMTTEQQQSIMDLADAFAGADEGENINEYRRLFEEVEEATPWDEDEEE